MHETKIIIVVKTSEKLTTKETYEIMIDMKARMEGYHTEVPKPLVGADLNLGQFIEDGVEHNIIEIVRNMTEN